MKSIHTLMNEHEYVAVLIACAIGLGPAMFAMAVVILIS